MLATAGNGCISRIGGQHAGFNRCVATLDACKVQKARVTSHQRAAGEYGFRQAIQAAAGDCAGTVADALAAFQVFANRRMGFSSAAFLQTGLTTGCCIQGR